MIKSIDINADMGETSIEEVNSEIELMPFISSCQIATGGHAGDCDTMKVLIEAAKEYKVAIGAHPSYPDRKGFGRRSMPMDEKTLYKTLSEQLEGFLRIVQECDATMTHVKPHGALYHDMHQSEMVREVMCAVVTDVIPNVAVYGHAGHVLADFVTSKNLSYVHEAFADRRYMSCGWLVPRSSKYAVIRETDEVVNQVQHLLENEEIKTIDGTYLPLRADSICVHSDSQNVKQFLKRIFNVLNSIHVSISHPGSN